MGEEQQEKEQSWEFVKWVFKVLYSPMATFENIVKKPNVKGPILILLITLPIIVSVQYTSGARFFIETPFPEKDLWTEKPTDSPSFVWNSNDNITFDSDDYIVGNYSVSSSLINSSSIWMRLTNIESINGSEDEYNRLSFRIKWVNEANITPNAILQLFSHGNESNSFKLNIKPLIANYTNAWANITVNLVADNWEPHQGSPSWDNITGVGLQLEWSSQANITTKMDDLFFGKYVSILSSSSFDVLIIYSLMQGSINFLLEWFILSGIVFLALKSFSDWNGFWKNLFSIVGYVFSASIVYFGVLALLFLFLPSIFIPYNTTASEYYEIYQNSWGVPTSILNLLYYLWAIILCTIALKDIHELSWVKAFSIGLGAVVLSLLLSSFLLSAFF